jgi:predicted ATPase
MAVENLTIGNYRSLRDLSLTLMPVTVLVGPNGCGKTNCYRALELLHCAAIGGLGRRFAEEGGIGAMTWAGLSKRREEIREVRLSVSVTFDRYVYRFACGVPIPRGYGRPVKPSMFSLDPEVKEESLAVYVSDRKRPVPLYERAGHVITTRDENGQRHTTTDPLDPTESVLVQLIDPARYPELAMARHSIAGWRFYHQFRTDPHSPLRQAVPAVRAPVLAHDGSNLAATVQTIIEMGEAEAFEAAISRAFPGCRLTVVPIAGHRLQIEWHRPELSRPLGADELSDGTLRFLALAAALLTPRPPSLLVLNEPEAGLHPDVIPALADLIAQASTRGQVVVTTHLVPLAEALRERSGQEPIRLMLHNGETKNADEINELGGKVIRFR